MPVGAAARLVRTSWTAYLRAGPGEQFHVIDEIDALSPVDVQDCKGTWCLVISGQSQGYLPADVLQQSDLTPPHTAVAAQPQPCLDETLEGFRGHEGWRFCGR